MLLEKSCPGSSRSPVEQIASRTRVDKALRTAGVLTERDVRKKASGKLFATQTRGCGGVACNEQDMVPFDRTMQRLVANDRCVGDMDKGTVFPVRRPFRLRVTLPLIQGTVEAIMTPDGRETQADCRQAEAV